jgi:putative ABC transport system substrate-binding protein
MNCRSAYFVARILGGARPGDLPIEQPPKLDLIVNLKAAQTLGLRMPPFILQQATEVIQAEDAAG